MLKGKRFDPGVRAVRVESPRIPVGLLADDAGGSADPVSKHPVVKAKVHRGRKVQKASPKDRTQREPVPVESGSGGVRGEIDILCNTLTNRKARPLLESLHKGALLAGFDARMVDHQHVRPGSWLFVYGLGGLDRVRYLKRGKVAAFDLGYWDRKVSDRKYRVSINGFHCPQLILKGDTPPSHRWADSGLSVFESRNIDGPILLVGNGPKSAAVGASGWTEKMAWKLREKFPGRTIWYRPKPNRAHEQVNCDAIRTEEPVDLVLKEVGLVVCRHSNVAVDACRLGVPVACEDGAAACIYPTLDRWQEQPTFEQRKDFLRRLAWWQWSPVECETMMFWNWMKGQMSAH